MATHSNILAWRVPMDRRAWRATVHGGAKVTERLAQHSTLCYRSILCAFDSTLCFPEDPRGKLGSLQLLIELNQWAAFGEWARLGGLLFYPLLAVAVAAVTLPEAPALVDSPLGQLQLSHLWPS